MNWWGERGKVRLVAHQALHLRAALDAPRAPQRKQLPLVAREVAPTRRAAPRVTARASPPRSGPRRRRTRGQQPGLQLVTPGTVPRQRRGPSRTPGAA
jgi:hypothetical protein